MISYLILGSNCICIVEETEETINWIKNNPNFGDKSKQNIKTRQIEKSNLLNILGVNPSLISFGFVSFNSTHKKNRIYI